MAYVQIPKDLTKIRAKFILGLTRRQTVCFGAAAVTGLPFFFLLKGVMPTGAAALLMILVMLPSFMFGMYERNGLPLEKFLRLVITVRFVRPKIRTYQTNNLYAATGRQIRLYREVQAIVTNKQSRKPIYKATRGDNRRQG